MPNSQKDSLTEFEVILVPAETGQRLVNYFIDGAFFIALFFLCKAYLMPAEESVADTLAGPAPASVYGERLLMAFLYALYMGMIEAAFNGKTLGKLFTRTRAVNRDGSTISVKKGFSRGFCRLIPFEVFSALGNPPFPWHDQWTDTYVIDEKLSTRRLAR
jgi:uncharacterized RDD family membrane protein YckC